MEGSLDAPTRHAIRWRDEAFYDEPALEKELRRVFDICHGCRRCFNLCDSFPILFDAIDASPNEQVDDLTPAQLGAVVDACTLCDMCFMTNCPYVPPHPFDLDFPHLMLRHRAVAHRSDKTSLADRELAKMGRNGRLGSVFSGLANWATRERNSLTRPAMEDALGIEACIHLALGDERIAARAEGDIERTRASDGKASAVHFVHFDFTPAQVERWRTGEGSAMLVIDHPNYGHAALIGPDTRAFLARECFA